MSWAFLIAYETGQIFKTDYWSSGRQLVTLMEKNNQRFEILQALKYLCVTFFGLYVCLQITQAVELIFVNAKLEFW